MNQPDRQVQPSLHAAGEGLDAIFLAVEQADPVKQFVDANGQSPASDAVDLTEEAHVALGAHLVVEGDLLGDQADHTLGANDVGNRDSCDRSRAAARLQIGCQHVDRGALPSAVRPKQAEDLARVDLKADALDDLAITKGLTQLPRVDNRLGLNWLSLDAD